VLFRSWVGATLIRIVLDDYRWNAKTWDKLEEDDPYFHVQLDAGATAGEQVYWPGGVWAREDGGDGRHYAAGYYPSVKMQATAKVKRIFALAPWLPQQAVLTLTTATASQTPILRADWFLWETAIQAGRKVGYYGLLEVKNRADFQRLTGFDQKLSEEFSRELRAAVANSGVTINPRRIARFEKIGGAYWTSFDVKDSKDRKNPLRVLNGGFQHDAEEVFSAGSNGLWKTALFDANGTLQEFVPPEIAHDRTSHSNDLRVHVGTLSCFRCHDAAKGHDGLQPVNDWARRLFTLPLALTSPDYQKLKELRQAYLRKLEPFMVVDRARHAAAVKEACGLSASEWAQGLARVYAEYDQPVTLARAAADVGLSKQAFLAALERYTKASGATNTVLGMFLRPENDQEPLPLDTWHEEYVNAQTILVGTKP